MAIFMYFLEVKMVNMGPIDFRGRRGVHSPGIEQHPTEQFMGQKPTKN